MRIKLLLTVLLIIAGHTYAQDGLKYQIDAEADQTSANTITQSIIPKFDSIVIRFSSRDKSSTLMRKYYDSMMAENLKDNYIRMRINPDDNISYYYYNSRTPIVRPEINSNMPFIKPDPNVRFHILEKRVIMQPPETMTVCPPGWDAPTMKPQIR